MSIDQTMLRMLLRLHERYALSGRLLTLGVQDVMLSHADAEKLFREAHFQFTPITEDERRYTQSKVMRLYKDILAIDKPMHVHDLFTMMRFSEVATLECVRCRETNNYP